MNTVNPIIQALENLAAGKGMPSACPAVTAAQVSAARASLAAPAVMACMIVAPPLPTDATSAHIGLQGVARSGARGAGADGYAIAARHAA
jgi:hypothetical protein